MSEVEINGTLYRCGKLPTRLQLRVLKRLAPVAHMLLPMMGGAIGIFEALESVSNTVHLLSDADADYVMDTTLSYVAWRQGASWQPLLAQGGGAVMNGGADRLDVQLRLFWEVLHESLNDFSLALLLPFLTRPNGADQEAQQEAQEQGEAAMVQRPTAALNS